MKHSNLRNIFLTAAITCIAAQPVFDTVTLPAGAQQKNTTARKSPVTSADAKRQQEATQKEIKQTEAQIKENERSVKSGLNELGKLSGDITNSKNKIAATTKQINTLNGQISQLETSISTNEAELKRLRDEYLKALKKMRLSKKKNSGLAFIFASDNFNQALRRMRYLKQFSEWKDRQSSAIDSKNQQLKSEKETLGKTKNEHAAALKRQQAEQDALNTQYAKQDAIVIELKKNGDALKTHLAKKQAEANELRNRIASLIAEEERKAAEERARQEAARKAEEERRAREEEARIAAEKAAAEKAAAEKAAAEKAALEAERERKQAELERKQAEKDEKKKKEAEKKLREAEKKKQDADRKLKEAEKKKKEADEKKKAAEEQKEAPKDYADARKRTPRGEAASNSNSAAKDNGNFGSMKGSLPRPVSGSFKVTSRFGRQPYPGLPDVVYENTGIDAEVNAGASALAVYGGKVSAIFVDHSYNTVIMVNHGNYFTVYANLISSAVKVGDKVNAGQALGKVASDEDDPNIGSIHFEVWRNREKMNPLEWIK